MMIGPEQSKKPSGKSDKKKDKAKKAKRHAADVEPGTPFAAETPGPGASERHDGGAEAAAVAARPAFGPPLLAWIDRVQERVDHLLTLTDAPAEAPPAPEPAATPPAVETAEDEAQRLSLAEAWARRLEATEGSAPEAADDDADATDGPVLETTDDDVDVETAAETVETHEPALDEPADDEPVPDEHDDEPFEPVAARLSAVLVARELIARGVAPTDVRRRLREGYGVDDPDAVLSRVVAA